MQRLLTIANSDYLGKDTALAFLAGQVLAGMAWVRPAAVNVTQVVCYIGDKDSASTYYLVQIGSTGLPALVSRLTGGAQTSATWGSAITANTQHLIAWKISANEGTLSISVNGGAWVTATTPNTGILTVSDRINWGRAGDSTAGFYYGGGLGPGGIWRGYDLPIEQVQAVYRGLSIARVAAQYRSGLWTFRTDGAVVEPDYSSAGLSLTPSGNIPASANGPPVGTARRDISARWARPTYIPPSPPPPPPPPGQVQLISASAISAQRNGAGGVPRTTPLSFDATAVAAGSTMLVMTVAIQPETSAASIDKVEWGSFALTREASDHYLGDASAVSITCWSLKNPPTNSALVPKVTTNGPTWSGAVRLYGLAGVDDAVVRLASQDDRTASGPSSPSVQLTGFQGELMLFMAAMQGNDGGTPSFSWEGAANTASAISSSASTTTDITVAAASKAILPFQTSEAPLVTWAVSDGGGAGLFAITASPTEGGVNAPVANFTASATTGVAPLAVTFTDTSTGSGIYAWEWDFGNGGSATTRNASYTYQYAGTYTVTLRVTSPGGQHTKSVTITVTQPSITITCVTDVISGLDQGDTTTINVVANDTGAGLSVVSVAGADKCTATVISSTTIQVTAFSTATGSDRLTYTVQDANGQQATGTLDVYFTGTTPPPTSSAEVDIAYRYIGYTGFGGSQGNVHQAGGQWWRFLAARSGTLDQFLMFTQGARPNFEQGDEHAKWNYGEYTITVYQYTGPAGASLPQGNVGTSAQRVLLGGTKGKFYPARPRPTAARTDVFNPLTTKPGQTGGAYYQEASSDGTFMSDQGDRLANETGGWFQSYNTIKDAKPDTAPWNATNRYGGTGWIVVGVGRTVNGNWASGIPVNRGDILLVEYKNNTPSAGHTMSNDVHMVYGPVTRPDLGLRVPGDPVRAVFGADQNRDWRKTPCYAMRIGGLWYGDAVTLTHSTTNGLGTTSPRKDVRKITRGQWVRQVITMPSDFEGETVNEVCVWAWKLTSPNGSDASGDLEVAVWRAPYTAAGSPTFTDVTGWVTIPQGSFGALWDHPHSRNGLGNVKATSLSQIMGYGFATIADLDVTKDYHYAIVARSSFGSAVYATSSMISAANRLNRTTTASSVRMDAEGVFPRLPCWGASDVINGRRFNVAQYSPDQGSSWLPQDTASGAAGIVWPFSLKPKS